MLQAKTERCLKSKELDEDKFCAETEKECCRYCDGEDSP